MGKVIRKREVLDRVLAATSLLDGVVGKVGYFPTAKYPDGTPVAYVASIHEFGVASKSIPPRPTMRPTIEAQGKVWAAAFANGAKAITRGSFSPVQVMDGVGLAAAGDVAKAIATLQAPPLKPATVAARRRRYANTGKTGNLTKPLVDTSIMVASLTHVTESKS